MPLMRYLIIRTVFNLYVDEDDDVKFDANDDVTADADTCDDAGDDDIVNYINDNKDCGNDSDGQRPLVIIVIK